MKVETTVLIGPSGWGDSSGGGAKLGIQTGVFNNRGDDVWKGVRGQAVDRVAPGMVTVREWNLVVNAVYIRLGDA